jgi:aminoglycoside/choline kinase family phosphotransferase
MRFDPAPVEIDQVLDPQWLTAALVGAHPDARIDAADVTWTLSNTATKMRVALQVANAPEGTPTHICIKGMFGEAARPYRASGVSGKEVRFYQKLRPILSEAGMNLPPLLYGAIDDATGHGLFIMPDLVPEGCQFFDPLTPYSVDQAFQSVEQLARLHATGCRDASLRQQAWIDPMLDRMVETPFVTRERLQELLHDGRSDAFAPGLRDAATVHGALPLLAAHLRHQPVTLVHGDAHAGNLYQLPGTQGIGIIDWQLIQRGCWALDIAYHLGAALSVEARRTHERDLLDSYLDRLASFGGPRVDREEGWRCYRMAMVYGYYLWSITQRVDRPIILEFMQRLGSAATDLDSRQLVEVG